MKKTAWCSMMVILVALLAAGCGAQSAPASGPGLQNVQPTNNNYGGPGPGDSGPGGGQPGADVQIDFGADSTTLQPGQCTNLQWSVRGGISVRLDGQPVDPIGQRQVCPNATTTYRLEVDAGGRIEARDVTIQVSGGGGPAATNKPSGGGGPTPTNKTGGGGGPALTPTVKTGGGGGGSGPTHTPITSQGYVDIGISAISQDDNPDVNPDLWSIEVWFKNFGTKKWSTSEDPSSSGDLEFRCSRSFTVGGNINTSTYNGSVPRDQIDNPGEFYRAVPWWIDVTGVTAMTVSCSISKGPTYDSDPSNNSLQEQWDLTK